MLHTQYMQFMNLTKNVCLTTSIIILIAVLHSCEVQDKKPEYNSEAIELNHKAAELMLTMEYDSALILLHKAIKTDTSYYAPYTNLIAIYISRKQFDKALEASNKIVEKEPELAEGWTFAGMLHDRLGDSLTAVDYYKKSIELYEKRIDNPNKQKDIVANRMNRAVSLILLGKETEGKSELKKLIAENPDELRIDEFLKLSKRDIIRQLIDEQ